MAKQSKYFEEEYIEAYLLGRLPVDEIADFDKAMAQNEELYNTVNEQRKRIASIELTEKAILKEHFQQLDKKHQAAEKKQLRSVLAIAASLLVLVAAGYFIYQATKSADTHQIYISHYTPYPVIEQGILRGENGTHQVEQGLQAYEQGRYSAAIDLLDRYLTKDTGNVFVQFYLGLSFLSNDQAGQAVEVLKPISERANFKLAYQAKWYLGLAYLKTGAIEQASIIFQHLQQESEDPSIQRKSKAILKEL